MYRPTGPREVWAEHLMSNPSSFSATAGLTSDDWLYTAAVDGTPARGGQSGTSLHARDTTTYAARPVEQSWEPDRLYGTFSPAKVTASAQGATRMGQLT